MIVLPRPTSLPVRITTKSQVTRLLVLLLGQFLIRATVGHHGHKSDSESCETKYQYEKDEFIKINHKSRYFYPKKYTQVKSPVQSRDVCIRLGLEPALVETIEDFNILAAALYYDDDKLNQQRFHFHIDGTTNSKGDGIYKSFISGKDLLFQAFMLTRGREYFNKTLNCLSITCSINADCHFRPRSCEDAVGIPLCQYPKGTSCNSKHGGGERKGELQRLGKTDAKVYFGSNVQKTWSEAMANCHALGLNLISFEKHDPDDTADTFDVIHELKHILNTPMWMGQTWTAGKFKNRFGRDEHFTFKTFFPESKTLWKYSDNEDHWDWQDSGVSDPKSEVCLLTISNNQTRPVLCDMTNYFICWKLKHHHEKHEQVDNHALSIPLPPPEELVGKGRHRMGTKKPGQDESQPSVDYFDQGDVVDTDTNISPVEPKSTKPHDPEGGTGQDSDESFSPLSSGVTAAPKPSGARPQGRSFQSGRKIDEGGQALPMGRSIRYGETGRQTGRSMPGKGGARPPPPKRPPSTTALPTVKSSSPVSPGAGGEGPQGRSIQSGGSVGAAGGDQSLKGRSIRHGDVAQPGKSTKGKGKTHPPPPARSPKLPEKVAPPTQGNEGRGVQGRAIQGEEAGKGGEVKSSGSRSIRYGDISQPRSTKGKGK